MAESGATIIDKQPDVTVVRVQSDRLDESNIGQVRSEVAAAGAETPEHAVVLDLSNIAFLPSLSLAGLIQLSQIFRSRGQRFALVITHPEVRGVFTVTRLDRLFEIHENVADVQGR